MWKFPHQWFRKYTVCMCVISRLWECMYGYDTIQVVVLYVCMFINHDQQLLWGGFICAGTPVFSRGLASLSGGWIQCSNWNIASSNLGGNPKPSIWHFHCFRWLRDHVEWIAKVPLLDNHSLSFVSTWGTSQMQLLLLQVTISDWEKFIIYQYLVYCQA